MSSTSTKISERIPRRRKVAIKYAFPALDAYGETASLDELSLNIRTYICANGLCNLQHNCPHRRILNYNWNKMKNSTNEIDDTIIKIKNKIINKWLLKLATNRNKIKPINLTDTLDILRLYWQ